LSSFLLLSPLLEPSLLFFLLSVRSLLGAVAVTPPPKKKKKVKGCIWQVLTVKAVELCAEGTHGGQRSLSGHRQAMKACKKGEQKKV
jgi:hypothetical protein